MANCSLDDEKAAKALEEASFLEAFMTLAEKREAAARQQEERDAAVQSFIELSGGNRGEDPTKQRPTMIDPYKKGCCNTSATSAAV